MQLIIALILFFGPQVEPTATEPPITLPTPTPVIGTPHPGTPPPPNTPTPAPTQTPAAPGALWFMLPIYGCNQPTPCIYVPRQ